MTEDRPDIFKTKWFRAAKHAQDAGAGKIYDFGIRVIKHDYAAFKTEGKDKVKPYSEDYEPNPYVFQYDLCVHIFFNFDDILKREVELLRETAEKEKDKKLMEVAEKIEESNTFRGIRREDFFWCAAELRWPTKEVNGMLMGLLVKDEWAEKRISGICSDYKYNFSFGGGGQGKTHTYLAFMIIGWDHYMFTAKGGRCMFSTVNKDKLNQTSWSYVQRLYRSTSPLLSLYAGKGHISGEWTISRPGEAKKDKGGIIKGLLVGVNMDETAIIDKLTGAHGHPFVCYLIDELQSSSEAPIKAAQNFTLSAHRYWIFAAGNYNEDTDSLGNNVRPDNGWDSVDENTGQWVSTTITGQKALVLHFNNNNSPGMKDPKKYWYLPTRAKLNKVYPDESNRDIEKNTAYRRFWVGWRVENEDGNSILTASIIAQNGCDKKLDLDKNNPIHNFGSFDSAQAEQDRNLLGWFQDGIDSETKQWVWGPKRIFPLTKSTDSLKYYAQSSNEILRICNSSGIKSGQLILDWTGRPAHAEELMKNQFQTKQLVYNSRVPDGKSLDERLGYRPPALVIDSTGEFIIYAHHKVANKISLGAFALSCYARTGRLRNINLETLSSAIPAGRELSIELYQRKFKNKYSPNGVQQILDKKEEFKDQYGFSPDLLDILFQAAYYMFVYRSMPLYNAEIEYKRPYDPDEEDGANEVNKIWEGQLLQTQEGDDSSVEPLIYGY